MPYLYKKAREAGVEDEDIVSYLKTKHPDYKYDEALNAGISVEEIVDYFNDKESVPKYLSPETKPEEVPTPEVGKLKLGYGLEQPKTEEQKLEELQSTEWNETPVIKTEFATAPASTTEVKQNVQQKQISFAQPETGTENYPSMVLPAERQVTPELQPEELKAKKRKYEEMPALPPTSHLKALGMGAAETIPGVEFKGEEAAATRKEHPYLYGAGQLEAGVLEAFAGSPVVKAGLKAITNPVIREIATNAIVMAGLTGGKQAENVIKGKESFQNAFINILQGAGASTVLTAAPMLAKGFKVPGIDVTLSKNAVEAASMPLSLYGYEYAVAKLRGEKTDKDWILRQLPNIGLAGGFALVHLTSGKKFTATKEELERSPKTVFAKMNEFAKGKDNLKLIDSEGNEIKKLTATETTPVETIPKEESDVPFFIKDSYEKEMKKTEEQYNKAKELKDTELAQVLGKQWEKVKSLSRPEEISFKEKPQQEEIAFDAEQYNKEQELKKTAGSQPEKGTPLVTEVKPFEYKTMEEINATRKPIEKLSPEELGTAAENIGKEAEIANQSYESTKSKLDIEKEYTDFASKLRQEAFHEDVTGLTTKGKEYKRSELISSLSKEDWASLTGETTKTRSKETNDKLQKIADAYNLAKKYGTEMTIIEVPPERILNSVDNWHFDDVATLLSSGFNKKQYAEWNRNWESKYDKNENAYEKYLEESGKMADNIYTRMDKLNLKQPEFGKETQDLFKGTNLEDTRTEGQKKLAEEIKLKNEKAIGGKADIEGLPFFEGGAGRVAGTEQGNLFAKPPETKSKEMIQTPYKEMEYAGQGGYVDLEIKSKLPEVMHEAYQDLVNRFHSIDRITDLAKTEIKVSDIDNPSLNAKLYLGVQGKAEAKLFWARHKFDKDGKLIKTGKSFKDIIQQVPKKEMETFDKYLVYRHVPEAEASGIKTGINIEEANRFIDKHQAKYENIAKEYTLYMDALLYELKDAGILTQSKIDAIKKNKDKYAPLHRVIDDLEKYNYIPSSTNIFNKVKSPIYKRKGSELPIKSPVETAIKMTYLVTNAVERARIFNSIVNLSKLSPKVSKIIKPIKPKMDVVATLEDGTKIYRPSKMQEEGIIEGFVDGNRKFYQVPKELYETMSGMSEVMNNWILKVAAMPARLLRTGATSTVEFALRNPVRDQWTAYINAKYGYIPFYDFSKGLFSLLGKTEDYWKWKASGASWSSLVDLDRVTTKENLKTLLGDVDYNRYFKSPISLLEDFSSLFEKPTRLGVFKKAAKKTSDIEAAVQSREASVDFSRVGAKMKVVSSLYTFFNARLQGMDKLIRTFKERPMETMAKVTAVAVVPSVINYLINRDDPDYWQIPQWQRDLFWIIKVKDTYLRIPKGEVGIAFGTSTEKILEYLDRNKEGGIKLDKLATTILKESLPISDIGGVIPVAMRPLVETWTNYNFFKKRQIVPYSQQKLEPKLQYSQFTSEVAKTIGSKLNLSPSKLENLLTGYTAGLGRYGLKLSDVAIKEIKGTESKERPKEPADYPGISAFIVRDPKGFNSESVQRFYDVIEKLERTDLSLKDYIKKGSEKEAKEYISKNKINLMAIHRKRQDEFSRGNERTLYDAAKEARTILNEIRIAGNKVIEGNDSEDVKRNKLKLLDQFVMKLVIPIDYEYRLLQEKTKGLEQ